MDTVIVRLRGPHAVVVLAVLISSGAVHAETVVGLRGGHAWRGHEHYGADRQRFVGSGFGYARTDATTWLSFGMNFDLRAGGGQFERNGARFPFDNWSTSDRTFDLVEELFFTTTGRTRLRLGIGAGLALTHFSSDPDVGDGDVHYDENLRGYVIQPSAAILYRSLTITVVGKIRDVDGDAVSTIRSAGVRMENKVQRQYQSLRPEAIWAVRRWHLGVGIEVERSRSRHLDERIWEWTDWGDWEYAPYVSIGIEL